MKKEILIVDDEIIIVRQIENILHDLGYHVCGFADSAADAVQQAGDHRPDLVLMDINLSGEEDGIQAAEKIKELYEIPVIYVTAFAGPQLLARARITEPYGYLLKPVEPRALEVAISIALYRHQMEKERTALQAQLYQAKKMETIGTLAGGLAHNFNNILWVVMGFTELGLLNLPEDSKARKDFQRALEGCERAKNIVSQFLTFSRQAENKRQKVQLETVIGETLISLQETLPSNITVDLHNETIPGFVAANPARFQEMLGHLYSNAIHAMQTAGGVLGVKLEAITLREEQKKPGQSLPPGPYWQLTISDTGHGMDQTVIDRIFDPFFTTKEVGKGLGLGLSVVYGIIRSHDGGISITSEPNKGTTVTILLPKVDN